MRMKICLYFSFVVMWIWLYVNRYLSVCVCVQLVVWRWSCCFKCVFLSRFAYLLTLCVVEQRRRRRRHQYKKWFVRFGLAISYGNEIPSCVCVSLFCTLVSMCCRKCHEVGSNTHFNGFAWIFKFQRICYEKKIFEKNCVLNVLEWNSPDIILHSIAVGLKFQL